jgi:hypothetical protein
MAALAVEIMGEEGNARDTTHVSGGNPNGAS